MCRSAWLMLILAGSLAAGCVSADCCDQDEHASPAAAREGFERLVALEGEWVGDAPPDAPGPMTVTYKVTGGGTAVVETLFAGTPEEMITVYTLDAGELVLTHYCSLGNQPHMRAGPMHGDVLAFHFIGGANIDPETDAHLHEARFEFVSDRELVTQWTGWTEGQASSEHSPKLRLMRKGSS